jgi:hypothetical protein
MADNTANIGFEKQIWDAACVLRGNIDASEYKSVVLGLIITTLDTIDKIYNEETVLHGMLNGVNIRSHSFEMSVEGLGIVRGTALPETLMAIIEKIGTEIDASMIKSNSFTKAGVQTTSWYMVSADM